jgi:hypothetical protein
MSSWLWVLLEGQADPIKIDASGVQDLFDVIPRIKEAFKEKLSSIPPGEIQFLSSNNRTQPLRKDTLITSIHATAISPLVVRYPFSDCTIVIRCNLSNSWFRQQWPHSSGLWHILRAAALEHFSPLNGSEFFFVVKDPAEQQITNEFQFNRVVQKAQINDENERQISLSVRIKGKKAYGEWDLRDVLQNILHKSWSSLNSAPRLNLDGFEQIEVSDDTFKLLIDELQKNADVFGDVTRNEMTCREFISPFLTTAVKHLQVNEPLLALRAEEELNGSRGFGPVDYTVVLDDIVICVTEAKKMDFDKGAAQNIVQMHSAVESLSKRKREDTDLEDSEEVPVMVYGIVSNARNWLFLQWAGTENDPVLYVSDMQSCNFGNAEIMKMEAKNIATYITAILQEQIRGLNTERRRVPKKPRLSL